MNYEKKYKEALEWMRDLYPTMKGMVKEDAEYHFPELKESKDEEIRRAIISYIKNSTVQVDNKIFKSWISWLEKQGEWKSIQNVPTREIILAIWELGNKWKELTYGRVGTEHGTQLNYIQKHWQESNYYLQEKQSGQNNIINISEEEKIKMQQDNLDSHKELLENQGEQKPTIQPRFKVGDWIIYKDNIWKICNISLGAYYELLKTNNEVSIRHFEDVDKTAHLWTIQDAKEDDVLTTDMVIFIFDYEDTNSVFMKYGYSLTSNKFYLSDTVEVCANYVHPATKEQRDLLFSKMKEAGYGWDAEKKERKIEQKLEEKPLISLKDFQEAFELKAKQYDINLPNRGYDIHAMCKELYSLLIKQKPTERISVSEELYEHIRNAHACMEEANCSDEKLKPKWKQDRYDQAREDLEEAMKLISIEQKPIEWSEEDDKKINYLIALLQNSTMHNPALRTANEETENLIKFLKERVQLQNTITDEELGQAKKDAYNDALDKIEYHSGEPTFDDGWSAAIWYLKKRNAQPQNTWKPSDEQIEALRNTIFYLTTHGINPYNDGVLESIEELLEQLKKLKENRL